MRLELDDEELEKLYVETEEERKEKAKLLSEAEAPVEFKGQVLKKWLNAKSGYVLSPKQQRLKKIGQLRHLMLDRYLFDRFIKEKWYEKGIDYKVFDVAQEGADAIVYNRKGWIPLEVYELANLSRYREPFPARKIAKDPTGRKWIRKRYQQQRQQKRKDREHLSYNILQYIGITMKAIDFYYLFENFYTFISNQSIRRYITNLTKFDCKRYMVLSYQENITDYALWKFAEAGIRIKVLGFQD